MADTWGVSRYENPSSYTLEICALCSTCATLQLKSYKTKQMIGQSKSEKPKSTALSETPAALYTVRVLCAEEPHPEHPWLLLDPKGDSDGHCTSGPRKKM